MMAKEGGRKGGSTGVSLNSVNLKRQILHCHVWRRVFTTAGLFLAFIYLDFTICESASAAGGFSLPPSPNTENLLRRMAELAPPLSNYPDLFG
jgi:hypothetical protein